jgi:hypothetical protein
VHTGEFPNGAIRGQLAPLKVDSHNGDGHKDSHEGDSDDGYSHAGDSHTHDH